ncbi:MAG: 1-phosphofructokinase [Clostridia bacterium]|nr:1-phosphofructokinase [Clostridia bacterium]
MIFTVTLNPAIDKTVVIPSFRVDTVNRIGQMRIDVGGKGINVSKCFRNLGLDSTAAAFLGGAGGVQSLELMKEAGLKPLIVDVPGGNTRTNLKIIDPELHQNTDINEPGPQVDEALMLKLRNAIAEQMQPGDVVILAGSLPKGADIATYRDWAAFFKEHGARVFLDADGESLRLGLEAAPYMVKPNNEELARLLGKPLDTVEDLIAAGKELLAKGIEDVVISMGGDGALFVTDDKVVRAHPLKVPVRSTVGAGDSMVAALAYGFDQKLTREQTIKLSIAISAASVMCDGTQAPDPETIKELYEKVIIEEVK